MSWGTNVARDLSSCSVNVDVKMFFLFGFSRIADPNELLVEADIVNKPREVT